MEMVGQYAWTGGLLFVAVGLVQILMPIYLRWLLNWFEAPEGTESRWKGYYYSAVLCLTLLVRSFFSSSGITLLHKGCVLIGNYMGFLIGQKIASLRGSARPHISLGKLSNLLTSDSRTIQGSLVTLDQVYVTVLLIFILTGMLVFITGWVAFFVPLVVIVCLPINQVINKLQTK